MSYFSQPNNQKLNFAANNEFEISSNRSKKETAPFVQVLMEIVEDRTISLGAFRLYVLLTGYGRGFGACWPAQATLAAKLGVSERTIYQWLKELEKAALIEIVHRSSPERDQTNLYHLKKLVPKMARADKSDTMAFYSDNARPAVSARQDRNRPAHIAGDMKPIAAQDQPTGRVFPQSPEASFLNHRNSDSDKLHELHAESINKHNTHETGAVNKAGKSVNPAEVKAEPKETENVCVLPQSELVDKPDNGRQSETGSALIVNPELGPETKSAPLSFSHSEPTQSELQQTLTRYEVGQRKAFNLAKSLARAGKDSRYIEDWARWIKEQGHIRNPGGFLAKVLAELAPVPVSSGQPATQSGQPQLKIDPVIIKHLPRLIELEEGNLREARCDRDRQTAQERLNRYYTMQAQLQSENGKGGSAHVFAAAC